MKKKFYTYQEQEVIINQPWIDAEGIRILLPIGIEASHLVRNDIEKEMDASNEIYFKTRPRKIPTRKVIEKYHIDVNLIRREAQKERQFKERRN